VAVLRRRDARRLLAAVLERVEREVRETGDIVPGGADAEDAALVARPVSGVDGEHVRTAAHSSNGTGALGPDQAPAAIAATPAIAATTPAACAPLIRSPSQARASRTVISG
jgi:hypothetical protein